MLTFKRAIVLAFIFIIIFFFTSRSHSAASSSSSFALPKKAPLAAADADVSFNEQASAGGSAQDSISLNSNTGGAKDRNSAARPGRNGGVGKQTTTGNSRKVPNMAMMSLYDRLAYLYPYDVDTKFPAYIWQTWKYTPANDEFKFREQEATWSEKHPGFVHEVVTDAVAMKLLRLLYAGVPEVVEAYDALPLPVLRADFFRYLILLARGGIYSDIDTYAIRSALEWVPESVPHSVVGLVIGVEADPDRPDWNQWYSRRIQFCQWTIQAKPGHPALRSTVAKLTQEVLRRKRLGELRKFDSRDVIELTGPALWTDMLFEYMNDPRFFDLTTSQGLIDWHNFTGMESAKLVGDVIVLPITSFSPGVEQMGSKGYDDPMAFVKHDFEGTWKPDSERHIGDFTE